MRCQVSLVAACPGSLAHSPVLGIPDAEHPSPQEPMQKLIDVPTACQMLQIVMPAEPLQPLFVDFLQAQTEYKVVNFDQWTSFLRFTQDVRCFPPLQCCRFCFHADRCTTQSALRLACRASAVRSE